MIQNLMTIFIVVTDQDSQMDFEMEKLMYFFRICFMIQEE